MMLDVTKLKVSTVVKKMEVLRKKKKRPYLKSRMGKIFIMYSK